jgi:hypothetical protein
MWRSTGSGTNSLGSGLDIAILLVPIEVAIMCLLAAYFFSALQAKFWA